MKRKQLESLLSALIPTLRRFIERQVETASTQLRSMINELPKPKDGEDGKSVTIEDVEPLVSAIVDRKVPTAKDVATVVLEEIELPSAPTTEQVAAVVLQSMASADQIAEIVRAKLTIPTAQEVAELVPAAIVPTPEEVAALVKMPPLPSQDQLVDAVMLRVKIPTAKEIAAEWVAPTVELSPVEVPTIEQIIEQITPLIPKAGDIANEVRSRIHVPTAEEVAKHVPVPEIPQLPELPELPEIPTTKEIVDELLKQIPAAEKGEKGDRGESVDIAAIEQMVERHIESRVAKWALEWERRASDKLQKFLDSIEKPKDGADGLGFDDVQVKHDGRRHFDIVFERAGKTSKGFGFDVPLMLYCGVWKSGEHYEQGDTVTWDGCTWIAKTGTDEKPGQSDAWQLAVKKGRDGRDSDDPNKKGPARVRVAPRHSGEG